jgi:hypothetical protein
VKRGAFPEGGSEFQPRKEFGVRGPPAARAENAKALIARILKAFAAAGAGRSRLSEEEVAVESLCDSMNRRFPNQLRGFEGCRDLEIGSLRGAAGDYDPAVGNLGEFSLQIRAAAADPNGAAIWGCKTQPQAGTINN